MQKEYNKSNLQLIDNYISEFSLNVFDKIRNDTELEVAVEVEFRMTEVDEKKMIGQIELRYNVDILEKGEKKAKIIMTINALFNFLDNIDKKAFEGILKIDGSTVISHICRSYIASVTAQSGMPTIIMPLIDFNEFFKEAKQSNDENK